MGYQRTVHSGNCFRLPAMVESWLAICSLRAEAGEDLRAIVPGGAKLKGTCAPKPTSLVSSALRSGDIRSEISIFRARA